MRIENIQRESEEYYGEVLNVSMQYRKLLKKPQTQLKDIPQTLRSCAIGLFALSAFDLLIGFVFGFDGTITVLCVVTAILAVLGLGYAMFVSKTVQRQIRAYLSDSARSVFIIDEEGVGMEKEGAIALKLTWDSIAFARAFPKSVCFVPKMGKGMIVSIGRRYLSEIREEIHTRFIE